MVALLLSHGLVEDVMPGVAVFDHLVDDTPVGETSEVAVVDEDVDLELAGEVGVVVPGLLGVVAVDGVELEAAVSAPLNGVVE